MGKTDVEETKVANKQIKRCSTSWVIREAQIKSTMRYHSISTRLVKIVGNK